MNEFIDYERLEGLDAIRKAIDPNMSRRTFYRKHRTALKKILMEHDRWWLRGDRVRYFTFRRLLYEYMIVKKII